MAIRWKDLLVFALGENMLTRLDQVRCIELYPDVLSFVTAPSLGTALTPLDSAMVAEWHSGVRSGEPFQLEDTDKDQDTFETVQRHKVCMKEPFGEHHRRFDKSMMFVCLQKNHQKFWWYDTRQADCRSPCDSVLYFLVKEERYFSQQVHKVSPIIVAVLERYSED